MGAESSWIAQQINRYLGNYAEASQHGLVLGPDCGYQIFPDDPNRVRFPDGSFIRSGRLPNEALPRGHIRVVPDLLLEVVSPNEAYTALEFPDRRADGVWSELKTSEPRVDACRRHLPRAYRSPFHRQHL